MILVDANLLLYAHNSQAPEHEASRRWLETTLSGSELVRLAWLTVWSFLRISTNARVFERPLAIGDAHRIVSSWLARPGVGMLEPGERHWEILQQLTSEGQAVGPMVMDAVLAAIAIEHGATLYTTDRDFARFGGLQWRDPLREAAPPA
jgi:toxin-antitoxin system PIN domain toxin